MAYKGRFTPTNPHKYAGDVNNIVWRSLWERRFFLFCDRTPGVIRWASEELIIPYISPVDGRPHRYFPDVLMEVQTAAGRKTFLVEIKPKKQAAPPKQKRKTRKYMVEAATYAVNQAKWDAAKAYCQTKGWTFMVVTEDHLFKRLSG